MSKILENLEIEAVETKLNLVDCSVFVKSVIFLLTNSKEK